MLESVGASDQEPEAVFLPIEAGGGMQDRQDNEMRERKEPAAQQDKNSQRAHAAVPQSL